MDVAFLLDSSSSIESGSYIDMKKFINEVIDHFKVSPKDTHVGVVSFSTQARTEISFTSKQTVDAIKSSVLNISYHGGSTRIDLGLIKTYAELFSAQGGMRTNMARVLLVITDGKSQDGESETKQQAQYLKDDGILIFALGIGSGIKMTELKSMVSMEHYVFLFSSVRQMLPSDKASEVALALCAVARTSNAIIHPVITQHSLLQHTVVSRVTSDDLECALMCIKHSLCYSFNFNASSRLCELSNARKADHLKDFVYDHGSVYNELMFV
ncbi:Matrilin-4 [Stylophora pistillata]|uniref:Matrilin-4 n=2 Tax=Stylophora pistillata TaxID=50429 RepID=A0A2B4SNH9_STYPI|nr:Matrilin-4 [Stylophora pistillata]